MTTGSKIPKNTTTANPLELYNAQNVDLLTNSKLEYDIINNMMIEFDTLKVLDYVANPPIIRVGQNSEIKEIETDLILLWNLLNFNDKRAIHSIVM